MAQSSDLLLNKEGTAEPGIVDQRLALPVQFTAIVVTYNEERRLRECLSSLMFCNQIIVVDLGSKDRSVEIAQALGIKVVRHEWVPLVERVLPDAVLLAQNDWILRCDPDEVFPPALVGDMIEMLGSVPSAGMVSLPHQFYFRGKPLTTTFWGQILYVPKLFHRQRVELLTQVHHAVCCKNGYEHVRIKANTRNVIQHYWVDTFGQLLEKHWRYLKHEGVSRYQRGERFTWRKWLGDTRGALKHNLINLNGLHGGFVGIFLSFFYAWYVSMSLLSLRRYQKLVEQGKATSSESSH